MLKIPLFIAIRHHSFCELYKTNLCQFCSLRIALKMCSHSNYLFQRCSLKNEVRGKCLKQLHPTKASFLQYLCVFKKLTEQHYTKCILVSVIAYPNTCILVIYFIYLYLRNSTNWRKDGREVFECQVFCSSYAYCNCIVTETRILIRDIDLSQVSSILVAKKNLLYALYISLKIDLPLEEIDRSFIVLCTW